MRFSCLHVLFATAGDERVVAGSRIRHQGWLWWWFWMEGWWQERVSLGEPCVHCVGWKNNPLESTSSSPLPLQPHAADPKWFSQKTSYKHHQDYPDLTLCHNHTHFQKHRVLIVVNQTKADPAIKPQKNH